MNTPIENNQPDQPNQPTRVRLKNRSGVALILVISFIVLISALVIGFFGRVTTELSSARVYAEGVNVRHGARHGHTGDQPETAMHAQIIGQRGVARARVRGCGLPTRWPLMLSYS